LMCDGSAVSRTTHSGLYSVIGTTYGAGNGSSTFNIPNLSNRVPVGKGSGSFASLNAQAGLERVTLGINEMPSHSHAIPTSFGDSSPWSMVRRGETAGGQSTGTNDTGGGQSHDNMPPYIVLNFIIKT
jgi:microcystin-dependent protein